MACLRDDLDDLLTCFCYKTLKERKRVCTTNAIERRFRKVRRLTLNHDLLRPTAGVSKRGRKKCD